MKYNMMILEILLKMLNIMYNKKIEFIIIYTTIYYF